MIVVTVPAFRLLWTNHDLLNEHRTRFTKHSFCLLAACAGIEIIEMRYFFIWLFAAKLVARVAESILRRGAGVTPIFSFPLKSFLYFVFLGGRRLSLQLRSLF